MNSCNKSPEIKNTNDHSFDLKGEVTFKGVTLTYDDTGITALKNISFTVKPGETIAILGKTGSGKTSDHQPYFSFV